MNASAKDGFAHTSLGRLHYLEAGSGRPLLLLHSNGASAYEFGHVIDALAEKHRVLAWDMPGHGDSAPLAGHLSVPDYAAQVTKFMDALGIRQANVAGASIGGAICIALAARHASRFKTIVAVEAPCRPAEDWISQWHVTERMFGIASQSLEQIKPRLRHVDDALLERWNIDRNKAGSKTMMSVMWALRDYDIVADMEKVAARTVAVFGSKSALRGKATLFAEKIAGCELLTIDDAGHFPMIDNPDAFVAALNNAIDQA